MVVVRLGPVEDVPDSVDELCVHVCCLGVTWDVETVQLLKLPLQLLLRHSVVEVDYSGAGGLEELNI